jgi:hypothetical protein
MAPEKTEQPPDTTTTQTKPQNVDMMARLAALTTSETQMAHEHRKAHPRDKFLEIDMPEIHEDHLMGTLENNDPNQIAAWNQKETTGKILARPFGTDVHYIPNHKIIAKELMTTIQEITEAPIVSVGEPVRDPRAHNTDRPLMTFLIHDISINNIALLSSRRVWASQNTMFKIIPFPTTRPALLFTIQGLATQSKEYIKELVSETWKDPISQNFFANIMNNHPNNLQNTLTQEISNFVYSIRVKCVKIKQEKGWDDPHFNIFADGELLQDTNIWLDTQNFFCQRTYRSPTLGRGQVKIGFFHCRLCHSKDHPKGLCPFPHLPRWKEKNKTFPTETYNTNNTRRGRRSFPPDGTRDRRPTQKP